ncbi:hypothetical protein ACV566_15330 [Staphylococcus aureus]
MLIKICKLELKNKLEDIALIYREFEQRIQNEFITGEDSLQYFY